MQDIRKGFEYACECVGITNFRVHDMRHTFASWLVQSGVPIYEVKELLRHESISTTEKYAHLAPVDTAKHVDVIARFTQSAHYSHTGTTDGSVINFEDAKILKFKEKFGRDGRI